jgi:Immunity protein 74
MAFTRKTNLIESTEGFSIEVLGRTGMRYCEEGRSVFVDSEILTTTGIAVWPTRMKSWDAPNENSPITPEDRRRIIENVERAFEFAGWRLVVS